MKKRLQAATFIAFSKHFFEPKVRLRGLSEQEIVQNLRAPTKLEFVEDQGTGHGRHKYGLLFHKSNKYDLKIVVSFEDRKINVITAYVQNKRRRKVYEEWLKRRK